MAISGRRFCLVLGAFIILLIYGVSIFMQPDYELAYDLPAKITSCTEGAGCISSYKIIIGNTGASEQKARLLLKAKPMREPVLPIKVKNFGVSLRPFTLEEKGTVLVIDLGTLDPGKRAEVTFALLSSDTGSALSPEDLFEELITAHGDVVRGSPEWITFSRVMFRLLS